MVKSIPMKKVILIHNEKQLDYFIEAGIKDYIFGMDSWNTINVGQINLDTFIRMVDKIEKIQGSVACLANKPIHEFELEDFKEFLLYFDSNQTISAYLVSDYSALQFKVSNLFKKPLIYAPDTLVTSSHDKQTFYQLGYQGCWIAPELSIEESEQIIGNDMNDYIQVFGYLKTSNSKRFLLTNYMHEIKCSESIHNNEQLTLIEETRKQKMPIIENDNGTTIFTDFVLYDTYRLQRLNNAAVHIYSALFMKNEDVLAAYNNQPLPNANEYVLDSYYWESESQIRKGE